MTGPILHRCPFRMAIAVSLLLAILGLERAPLIAQGAPPSDLPPVFEALEGRWSGSGTLLGRPASFQMTWEVRAGGFVTLSLSNATVDSLGNATPILDAMAIYRARGRSAVGVWMDSRPQSIQLTAQVTDSAVVTTWVAEAESGETVYRLLADGGVESIDRVRSGGDLQVFGRARYVESRPQPDLSASNALHPAAWLAGCWRLEAGGRVTDEQWMAPRGDAMVGMSRTVEDGSVVAHEFLSIEAREEGLYYVAVPSGQVRTEFALSEATDSSVAFENPAHDFPTRLEYVRTAPDGLRATASAADSRAEFPMSRVPCGAP